MRIAIVVVLMTALAGGSFADTLKDQQSREHFTRGQKLFEAADYEGALREFTQSYELTQYPAILYKIALCQDQLGHNAEAIEAYKGYLAADPKTPRRKGIEARLEKLQASATPPTTPPPATPPPPRAPTATTPPATTAPPATAATAPPVAPSPAVAAQPAATPQPAPVATEPRRDKPIYKKWWLWTAVGGVVVAGVVVGVAVAATTPRDASAPSGAIPIHFPTASVSQ